MPYARLRSKLLACSLLASAAALSPAPASAGSPFLVVPEASVAEATPAYRYANMTNEQALAELDRRKILYLKVAHAPGVRAPVRLTGRLNGVNFHSALPPEQRVTSPFEILDARLALTLDDFAAVLARHDIDEVLHFTMYRPNVPMPGRDGADREGEHDRAPPASKPPASEPPASEPPASEPPSVMPATLGKKGTLDAPVDDEAPRGHPGGSKQKGAPRAAAAAPSKPAQPIHGRAGAPRKPAGKAAPGTNRVGHPKAAAHPKTGAAPGQRRGNVARRSASGQKPRAVWAPPGTRHPAGLAIDVGALKKLDGTWISVARQFHGHIGDRTCGQGARLPELPEARELRSIVCESADLGIFTYVLTPNYNAAHADHYHMEIKPDVRWFLYN